MGMMRQSTMLFTPTNFLITIQNTSAACITVQFIQGYHFSSTTTYLPTYIMYIVDDGIIASLICINNYLMETQDWDCDIYNLLLQI